MKLTRIVCLSGLVALGAWSVSACSEDTKSNPGPDGGGGEESGGSGNGGKGTGGGSSGSGGKATGGSAGASTGGKGGASGAAGSGGKAGSAGSAGDSGVEPGDGGDPSIVITDPTTGETVSKDAEYTMFPKIPIAFKVSNFVLKAPGSTNCDIGKCGHVHLNVDGNDCNVDVNTPYNAPAVASPGIIDLSLCKAGVAGAHTVTASLHNNNHSGVTLVDGGDIVSSTITITAVVGDGGAGKTDAGDGG